MKHYEMGSQSKSERQVPLQQSLRHDFQNHAYHDHPQPLRKMGFQGAQHPEVF